jgi:hypothetical protein
VGLGFITDFLFRREDTKRSWQIEQHLCSEKITTRRARGANQVAGEGLKKWLERFDSGKGFRVSLASYFKKKADIGRSVVVKGGDFLLRDRAGRLKKPPEPGRRSGRNPEAKDLNLAGVGSCFQEAVL